MIIFWLKFFILWKKECWKEVWHHFFASVTNNLGFFICEISLQATLGSLLGKKLFTTNARFILNFTWWICVFYML